MPDLPSFDDLFSIARDEVLAANAKLSREAVEREGMDANAMVAAAAAVGDELVSQLSAVEAGLYTDSAEDEKLDRLLFDRFGLIRKGASPAVGTVTFLLTTANPAPFTISIGTELTTSSGGKFITTESGLFLAGETALIVAVRSANAGAAQKAKPDTIKGIAGQITGAPDGLTVSNPLATSGGDDRESNADFRDRGRTFWVNARRGTVGAIEQAALNTPGIVKAKAFEMLDALGRPARMVQLVVADRFTEQFADYTTVPPRYVAQSLQITQDVYAELYDIRAGGIYVQVWLANVQILQVSLQLAFYSNADVDLTATIARAAIVNYVNSLKPGQKFSRTDAAAMLAAVPGLAWTGQEIVSPAGDVVATPLVALRTGLALVSTASTQSGRPLTISLNPDAYSS